MGKIIVAGLGPGNPEYCIPAVIEAIRGSALVVCAGRLLSALPDHPNILPLRHIPDALRAVREALCEGDVVVCVSGNPGEYSLLPTILAECKDAEVQVLPGIGSVQALCCRLNETSHDSVLLSAHGRELSEDRLIGTVLHNKKTYLLLDQTRTAEWLCETLTRRGLGELEVVIGESLTYPQERVIRGKAKDLSGPFAELCIARVYHDNPRAASVAFGLPEHAFVRGGAPMTKSEIRAVVLSKLSLASDAVVWDIGAGTGSVAVECARLCGYGSVHAIEEDGDAAGLVRENCEKFGLHNLFLHAGRAPYALEGLPAPTHVFIGGSGGALEEILGHIARLGKSVRIVLTAVTLKTAGEAERLLMLPPFRDLECVQVSVSKGRQLAETHIWQAQNPVMIFSATIGETV